MLKIYNDIEKYKVHYILIFFSLIMLCSVSAQSTSQNTEKNQGQSTSQNTEKNQGQSISQNTEKNQGQSVSQNTEENQNIETAVEQGKIANTSNSFITTPGDNYLITYFDGIIPFEIIAQVNPDYTIKLGYLGSFNVKRMIFIEAKALIEKEILKILPKSNPVVSLIEVGLFNVLIKGEVIESKEVLCSGLTRLSDIIIENKTYYTSYRNIEIIDPSGNRERYDLYKAIYGGDIEHNPYISPDSIIKFERYEKKVTLKGEVFRPGEYQILSDETLSDLIYEYGNGFTDLADRSEIIQISFSNPDDISNSEKNDLNFLYDSQEILNNYDKIEIQSNSRFRPTFFIDGSLNATSVDTPTGNLKESNTTAIEFTPGTKLSSILYLLKDYFYENVDLSNAYYIDNDTKQTEQVDIESIVFYQDYTQDRIVKNGDRLVIPFKALYVTVNGGVMMPGRYPFVPDKNSFYYINLAGGFDENKNSHNATNIYDNSNRKINSNSIIEADYVITAKINSFMYHINLYMPLLTATTMITTLAITLINLN